MNVEEYTKEKLWEILVETVHALTLYTNHKVYVKERILPDKAEIEASELAVRMNMPLGEALVVLYELQNERKPQQ
ncbi:MAG TPA: hypothetical protein VMT01_03550 [Candidatus Acidoferrum sp.]|jgi:hypothetical protein|nr:hypothetical protein [Candidatus Acidoferrum sp.]